MTGYTPKPPSTFHAFRGLKSGVRNCRQTLGNIESKYFNDHFVFYRIKKYLKSSEYASIVSHGQDHEGFRSHLYKESFD